MSYILSALRKAESEREAREISAGERMKAAHHYSPAKTSSPMKLLWPSVFLVLALGILAYWFIGGRASTGSDGAGHAGLPAQSVTPGLSASEFSSSPQRDFGGDTANKITDVSTRYPPQVMEAHPPETQGLEASSEKLQSSLISPAINITGYIFFEDKPNNSKLFVDGIVYRHESRLPNGLTIKVFHENSVEVLYRGRLTEIKIP